jgi:Carboxypeptidase regulatory-like domain
MKRMKWTWAMGLVILALAAGFLSAQTRELAAIQGTVNDDTGAPLPGVTVTATSPGMLGKPSVLTDKDGRYRIPALLTGVYEVEATLSGFTPAKITGVAIHTGMTATVDIVLAPAKLEAEVTVLGAAPIVDVTNAALARTYITKDLLTSLPTAQDTHAILNLAPGVTQLSAYGGGDQAGNSWTVDGAEVSSSWFGGGQYSTPIDYNVVEEQQVIALGAPAEYSGFTGTAINIVTKSGGNDFHGDAQLLYRGDSWQSSNIKKDDPEWKLLGETPSTEYFSGSAHLGGPILKDKLWFFGGYEYYKQTIKLASTGKDSPRTLPKIYGKLTFQPSQRDRVQASYETHTYTALRTQMDTLVTADGNWDDKWDSNLVNASYVHTFSANSIFELKFGGNWGSWARYPSHKDHNKSGFWDLVNGTHACYWWSYQPDHKYTLRGAFTQGVDNLAGSHDFKAGLEAERTGGYWDMTYPGGVAYWTLNNQPYMAEAYHGYLGFDNWLFSGYVQDDWRISDSLVINPGLRYNVARGTVPNVDETVWKPHMGLEPRLGLVWDILGNQKTVLKAHVGKYYEGTRSYNFWTMTPRGDAIEYLTPEFGVLNYWFTVKGENLYSVDPNVKNPSMNQAVLGIEQVLGKNLSASVSVIYKKWLDFVDSVNLNATFEPVSYVNPITGQTMTVYNQTNVGAQPHYLITNPKVGANIGAAYPNIVMVDPSRKYRGIQFTLDKRFADRWQLSASYTYSKEEGSYSNAHTATGSYGTGETTNYWDPNLQINLYGRSSISPPHVFKIMASYILPLDITVSAVYVYNSGRTWTKTTTLTQLDQATKPYLMLEPMGDSRMKANNSLDFRLEKSFAFRTMSLAVMFDIFNALNQAIPWGQYGTYVNVFYGDNMGLPIYVCDPRVFRLGAKFTF